jgi:hypothetical protein
MKKSFVLMLAGIALLTSCTSKDVNLFEPEPTGSTVTESEIQANVKKVFGVEFDANHDWRTTVNGEITVNTDASVKKVQLLVNVRELDEAEDYVTTNAMRLLNEVSNTGKASIKLKYDAPKDNLGLYVAFTTNRTVIVKKVEGNTVSFDGGAMSRRTRALSAGYTLPEGEFTIGEKIESYASQRNWVPGEMLYGLSDYTAQKMSTDDYSDEFQELFRGIVFSYFPNGRSYNNLPKVKASGYYNEKVYPITTGDDPIVLTPMYKCDNAQKYGNEVYNSDLYYYYFKDEDLGNDPVAYLESLPKYKAIPFNQVFGETEDNVIGKHGSYALLYYGDGTPEIGTKGTYDFPKGYKLGFMVRAKTTVENGRKQGEVYGDGRLNNYINNYNGCNFKSSNLGEDGPRVAWLSLNDKMLMCWESGTDADFNDIIIDVEGGIEPFISIPDPDPEVYTYCFEDTELGDYDLNDIVIKAVRVNETTVQYSIVACGGWDELYVRNINSGVITDDAEVHGLFGKAPKQFINTRPGDEFCTPVSVSKTVDKSFSFLDTATQPYIYDKTTDTTVRLAEKGEDPHGIMIADNFQYPEEKICVKDAYLEFNSWGQNPINSTRWYTKPNTSRIYSK